MISRRGLLGAALVLAAGGAGAAVGSVRPARRRSPPPVATPEWLTAAADRESTLLTGLDAAIATATAASGNGDAAARARLGAVRADHAAHLRALHALRGRTVRPSASPTESPTRPAISQAGLRAAEQAAADAAAEDSAALRDSDAVLLASIAACEAGHAQLLT